MLLTHSPEQLACFERSGLRSIDFVIKRASASPGDMPAASLTGFFIPRLLPSEWIDDPRGPRAWIDAARASHADLFEGVVIRLAAALNAQVTERGHGSCPLRIELPAIDDEPVSQERAQAMAQAEIGHRPELLSRPDSVWGKPESRLRWAVYQATGDLAMARLSAFAPEALAALNAAAPRPACLPLVTQAPFGWFDPLKIESAAQAFELSFCIDAGRSAPIRAL